MNLSSARGRILLLTGILAAGAVVAGLGFGQGWPREQAFMAGIVVVAGLLWVTEAVPLFATSLLVVAAESLLLANPGGWRGLGFQSGEGLAFRDVLQAAVDPSIVLFFAGFLLARAAVKAGVDQAMASWLLRPFTGSPRALLGGVMAVTALFSMWMSNTATAAFMLTLTMPLLAQLSPADPFRKALLLAVPFAANIGGLGTPIASPPNAIAIGYLAREGYRLSFVGWMVVAVPLVVLMLAASLWILLRAFPTRAAALSFTLPIPKLTPQAGLVVAIFSSTVLLWLTEPLHGLPAATVSMLPIAVLVLSGTIDRADVNGLDWDILLLIGGGLALGFGLEATGLDERVVEILPAGDRVQVLFAALAILTWGFSIFLSNTAVANLLLPVGVAAAGSAGHAPTAIVLGIALTASIAMVLPISTPPNAMAYARGEFSVREMAGSGARIGAIGLIVILAVGILLG